MTSTLHTHHFPSIDDYDAAVARLARSRLRRIAVIEGDRDLGTRRQRACTIRDDHGTIAVRYHATDVLRYAPDGTVAITCYPSRNTGLLLRAVAPWIRWVQRPYDTTVLCVRTPDGARVVRPAAADLVLRPHGDGTATVVGGATTPITTYATDRKRMRAARVDVGVEGFTAWLTATQALTPRPLGRVFCWDGTWWYSIAAGGRYMSERVPTATVRGLPELMRHREHWLDLSETFGWGLMPMLTAELIRRDPSLCVATEHPWVAADQWNSAKRHLKPL